MLIKHQVETKKPSTTLVKANKKNKQKTNVSFPFRLYKQLSYNAP